MLSFILAAGCTATQSAPSSDIAELPDVANAGDLPQGADTVPADGSPADVVLAPDAGPTVPAAPIHALLETWFDDFNADTDQSYLDEPHTVELEGDPGLKNVAPHEFRRDVHYGPHGRNLLDIWLPKGVTGPTPIAVYVHGGGFKSGDKSPVKEVARFLDAGIAVASIIYRWSYKTESAALLAPKPNDIGDVHEINGTRMDYIFRDSARAVQFIRYRATEWNIDPERIGAWGGSAGGACVMWVGTIPDLADPKASDPVLRESTRLRAVGHRTGQATGNWSRWPELLGMSEDFVFGHIREHAGRTLQITLEDQIITPEGRELSEVVDYYEHIGLTDVAIFTDNSREDTDEAAIENENEVVHHPRAHVAIYERCVAMGLTCVIHTQSLKSDYVGDVYDFLIEELTHTSNEADQP